MREIHGFYVPDSQDVEKIMIKLDKFLKSLSISSTSQVWSMREKFDFALCLDLRIFFDIENGVDSYLSKAEDDNFMVN